MMSAINKGNIMDYNKVVAVVVENATPTNITLLVLLLVSEILGTSEKFKNSSIYMLAKDVLKSIWEAVFNRPTTQE